VTDRRRGRRPHGSSGAVATQDDTDPVAPKEAVEPLTRRSNDRAARGRVECGGRGGRGALVVACPPARPGPATSSPSCVSAPRPGPPPPQAADVRSTAPEPDARSLPTPAAGRAVALRHRRETLIVGPGRLSMPHPAVLQRSKGCGRLDLASAWHLRTVLRVATSGRGPRERSTKRLPLCVRRTRKFPRIADLIARGRAGKFLRVAPPPGRKRSGTVRV
jgi:hypothetical protein